MNSNLDINRKICIGTANFGQVYGFEKQSKVNEKEIKKIFEFCKSNNINTIDTAMNYGDAEKIIGKFDISNLNIISKLPSMKTYDFFQKCKIEKLIEGSLQKLRINHLYGLLFHDARNLLDLKSDLIFKKILSLKEQGLIKKIGVSIYDPQMLDMICSKYDFDIIQAPYNIFDRRIDDSGWLKKLYLRKTEIHVRSVFLQGMLLKNTNDLPLYFTKWESLWKKLDKLQKNQNLQKLDICLGFIKQNKNISKIIIGVEDYNQLQKIVKTLNKNLNLPRLNFFSKDEYLINPSKWEQ